VAFGFVKYWNLKAATKSYRKRAIYDLRMTIYARPEAAEGNDDL
jgi:hypothetical protein